MKVRIETDGLDLLSLASNATRVQVLLADNGELELLQVNVTIDILNRTTINKRREWKCSSVKAIFTQRP